LEAAPKPLRIPLTEVQSIRVKRGRRSLWKEGAATFFVPGALLGAHVVERAACDDEPDCTETGVAIKGALAFGIPSALLGAGLGALIKVDRWERATVRPQTVHLIPSWGRRTGLEIAIRF
jgi:hypothetical protein